MKHKGFKKMDKSFFNQEDRFMVMLLDLERQERE